MSISSIIILLYQTIIIITILHVLMDNRQPSKTMAWALVIYFIPLAGLLAYFIFGVNTRKERMASRHTMDQLTKRSMIEFVEQEHLQLPESETPLINLFVNQSFSLPFNHNKIDILTDGYAFFLSLLHDIAAAKDHIHIDVYIFEDDALGRLLTDALIDKARQGVKVRILYDDVGCWSVKTSFFERLRMEGIEAEAFMPVKIPSFANKVNYRNHRKIFVVDGRVGYIGGMNIALRYVKGRKHRPWRDTMLRIEGNGVYSLQRTFLIDWYFVDRTVLTDRRYYPEVNKGLSVDCIVQTVTSEPLAAYPEIMQGYMHIISSARKYLYIETPYFLPPDAILFALKTAAAAGVDVRLMTPRHSDGRLVEWGSRSFLKDMVDAGVKVLLYEKGFLHSKFMVCDDRIATCGSTNVDFRSLENNFEANMFVYNKEVAHRMKQVFLEDERLTTELRTLPKRMRPSFLARLGESIGRLISPLL